MAFFEDDNPNLLARRPGNADDHTAKERSSGNSPEVLNMVCSVQPVEVPLLGGRESAGKRTGKLSIIFGTGWVLAMLSLLH